MQVSSLPTNIRTTPRVERVPVEAHGFNFLLDCSTISAEAFHQFVRQRIGNNGLAHVQTVNVVRIVVPPRHQTTVRNSVIRQFGLAILSWCQVKDHRHPQGSRTGRRMHCWPRWMARTALWVSREFVRRVQVHCHDLVVNINRNVFFIDFTFCN